MTVNHLTRGGLGSHIFVFDAPCRVVLTRAEWILTRTRERLAGHQGGNELVVSLQFRRRVSGGESLCGGPVSK